jgi:type VI secretion system secreted protein Hcp
VGRQFTTSGPSVKAYLSLEGIEGEATAAGHENWIEVVAFGWGVHNEIAPVGTQMIARDGRVEFQDLVITKHIDKASPLLAVTCADGGSIGEAELVFYSGGSDDQPTGIVRLSGLQVRSVASTSGSSSGPTEVLSLTFSRVEWVYYEYDDRGRSGETRAGWDVASNSRL